MNPAIGLLEFDSVAAGIAAADAMVKRAPIGDLVTGSVQPGRYLVLIAGDVASVEESMEAGRETSAESLIAEIVLRDVHQGVAAALRGERIPGPVEALGVIETGSVAPLLAAADAGLKGAAVDLLEINLADGLGGKAYLLFGGTVADVEAAVSIGTSRVDVSELVGAVVIPQLHDELGDNLTHHSRFAVRLGREDDDAAR
ncbi:MAG: BMC domain-containing protein [Acidobacteria bacterium]|nr:BMC domain-containing protein [Acidobacteriota bacterium]